MLHGWLMVSPPVSSLGSPKPVFPHLPVTVHAALQQRGATFATIAAVFKKNRRGCLATALGAGGPPLLTKNPLNPGNLVQ